MAAAFGANLVFHVHGAGAGLDHRAHRARDVKGAAPARIDVDQQGQGSDFGDAGDIGQHVLQSADSQVGHAERVRGHAATRKIKRLVAGGFGHARGVSVDRADDLQRLFIGYCVAEFLSCAGLHAVLFLG